MRARQFVQIVQRQSNNVHVEEVRIESRFRLFSDENMFGMKIANKILGEEKRLRYSRRTTLDWIFLHFLQQGVIFMCFYEIINESGRLIFEK